MEINLNEKRKKGRPKKNIHITLNINSKDNISNQNVRVDNDPDSVRACQDNSINESSNSDNKVVNETDNVKNVNETVEIKKKRGRKKKEVVEEEIKVKKKRGRKAALKYFSSSIRKQIPLKTNIVDNENAILFLDIKDTTDNISNLTYDSFEEKTQYDINMNLNNDSYDTKMNLTSHNINTTLYDSCLENELDFAKVSINNMNSTLDKDNTINRSEQTQDLNDVNDGDNKIHLQKDNIKKGFFQLLNYFHDWKEKTHVKCWWCCHNFDTVPIGMPIKYDNKVKKFIVRGIFCSFGCMLAYSNNTQGVNPKKYLINYLYKKLTGHTIINFKEAPSKYVLKSFGGLLSIEEFRNVSNENKTYKMIEYPMYMSRDYIAEVDLANIKQVNTKVFNNISKVIELDDKKVEDAKFRISKIENPHLSNTIEDFIKN
jgi:hypothetical protein